MLDKVYTNIPDAYKAIPLSHLGQSDHISLLLLPRYTALISRVKPTVRTVKIWPEGAEAALQLVFQRTEWSLFATNATSDSQLDIETYTSSVLEYIKKGVNDNS